MSSDKDCCVPGCKESGGMRQVLHGFPNPENNRERFNTWLYAIGSNILGLPNGHIFKYRRVCRSHFEDRYLCRNNKISNIAVPTLNMPEMESRASASGEQLATLLEFMESHGDIAKLQLGAQGRVKSDRFWKELANTLNAIGGGVNKTSDKWKKMWADWKSKTKKKGLTIRRHANGTGGGPNTRPKLTVMEERVLGVIGALAVEGHSDIEEQEFDRPSGERLSTATSQIDINIVNKDGIAPPVSEVILTCPSTSRQQLPTPARRLPPQASTLPTPATPIPSIQEPLETSPHSSAASHRQRRRFVRRRRALTPFDRATSEFVGVEQRRLQFEKKREENEARRIEVEVKRQENEARRIEVEHDRNNILRNFANVAAAFLQQYMQNRD